MTVAISDTDFEREGISKALSALVVEIEEDLHQRLAEGKVAATDGRTRFEKETGQTATEPDAPAWTAWLSERLDHHKVGLALAYERLRGLHRNLLAKEQTSEKWDNWLDDQLAQVAVSWVLTLTFVRYLEDQGYLRESYVGGTDETREQAENRRLAYLREHQDHGEGEFFLDIFARMAKLPGCRDLFGQHHSPLWLVGPTGDGTRRLWAAFRAHHPASGKAVWDFAGADTRFLGDLYQNLSKSAREKFALLQTPDFVEEFILDYTLKPAWETFGPEGTKMIDPACGSGHFLLGAFWRFVQEFGRANTRLEKPALAAKALKHVHGVDLNPFAVAIARFRLLLAALDVCETRDLAGAWAFDIQVAVGDSLLCGELPPNRKGEFAFEGSQRWGSGPFSDIDYERADALLRQSYEVVVGNPPYITDKDAAHRQKVREAYHSASGIFSLAVPFTERFFHLARGRQGAGYVGMITANSFMKREFGTTFIEEVVPELDLTHVIDTQGAYLPGHGTPTVILFGRPRKPETATVRAVLGIRGEPSEPDEPALGKVWNSIVAMTSGPEAENDFLTVMNLDRKRLYSHPWSLAGGGAIELLDHLASIGTTRLNERTASIGFHCITKADEIFELDKRQLRVIDLDPEYSRDFGSGADVREWTILDAKMVIFPYDRSLDLVDIRSLPSLDRYLWPYRQALGERKVFGGKTYFEHGKEWWSFGQIPKGKFRPPSSITFAEIATHNHFVLDRGDKVFNRTAPVIKLPEGRTVEEHLSLLGLLNSSIGNFVCRQTCFPKGGDSVGTDGARVSKNPWEDRLQRAGTAVGKFPLVATGTRLLELTQALDHLGSDASPDLTYSESALDQAEQDRDRAFQRMVALQEELDWHVYGLYGLHPNPPAYPIDKLPLIVPGERAFEIALARLVEGGIENDLWFTRHGIKPRTSIPDHWPEDYHQVVQQRLDLIENERFFKLLETPVHKRRWSREAWPDLVKRKLQDKLLDKLESDDYWPEANIRSCSELARQAGADAEFVNWAQLYSGSEDPHLGSLVADLVMKQGVPYLDGLVYKTPGLRKRARWKETWALQRREDAGETVDIPVPPKYTAGDFLGSSYDHRGKLDVPKERFILYPGLETAEDPSMRIGWAGWDHNQRAQGLASRFHQGQTEEGWGPERLLPLLAGIGELLPWLFQWHNDVDPKYLQRMSEYYQTFATEEARRLDCTLEQVAKALPEVKKTKTSKAKAKPKKKTKPKAKARKGATAPSEGE